MECLPWDDWDMWCEYTSREAWGEERADIRMLVQHIYEAAIHGLNVDLPSWSWPYFPDEEDYLEMYEEIRRRREAEKEKRAS